MGKPRPRYKIYRKCPNPLRWRTVSFTETQSIQYCHGWLDAMDSVYPSAPYRIMKVTGATQEIIRETKGRAAPHVN